MVKSVPLKQSAWYLLVCSSCLSSEVSGIGKPQHKAAFPIITTKIFGTSLMTDVKLLLVLHLQANQTINQKWLIGLSTRSLYISHVLLDSVVLKFAWFWSKSWSKIAIFAISGINPKEVITKIFLSIYLLLHYMGVFGLIQTRAASSDGFSDLCNFDTPYYYY